MVQQMVEEEARKKAFIHAQLDMQVADERSASAASQQNEKALDR